MKRAGVMLVFAPALIRHDSKEATQILQVNSLGPLCSSTNGWGRVLILTDPRPRKSAAKAGVVAHYTQPEHHVAPPVV